jgi:uroporphyrinogen decarboxylase
MTNRERVLGALRRQETDRVPFEIGGFNREGGDQFRARTGTDDAGRYFGVAETNVHVFWGPTCHDIAARFLPFHDLPRENYRRELPPHPAPGLFTLNEWGTAFVVGSNAAYDHFVPPAAVVAAESPSDIERFPAPDFDQDYRWDGLEERVRAARARDLVTVGSVTCTLFERAWQVRGMDRLLVDLLESPSIADTLLDRHLADSLARTERFARAGVDVLYLGDDVGMQDRLIIAPDLWRRYFKGRMARIIDAARSIRPGIIVRYHSDGFIGPIIGDLVEVGVDVLDPVQPECMDPGEVKREFGDRLAFWGTFGIQHTLPFGTTADVEREVEERIGTVGRGGGLFLAPTHAIAPEVPYENIRAFVRAARRWGRYGDD